MFINKLISLLVQCLSCLNVIHKGNIGNAEYPLENLQRQQDIFVGKLQNYGLSEVATILIRELNFLSLVFSVVSSLV